MLLLLFEIGSTRYGLDVNQVIEVVPLVKLKTIPGTPRYVAGLMNYRGEWLPVIDLNELHGATPFEDAFSTRIIILNYPVMNKGNRHLALIANDMTETLQTRLTSPPPAGIIMDKSLHGGAGLVETSDMIQWFDINEMLPAKEINLLFE